MSLRRGSAFWLMGGLLGTLMIAAGAPSPLYGVYQATWHFSAVTLTAVFAVYAAALLAAFLVAGRLSDHLGRKPVVIVALLIEAAAMACFAVADSTGWLCTARVVQGIATGMATGAISAALVDLAPRQPAGRSAGCTSRWGHRWRRNCCTRRTRWRAGRSSSC
jgi:MFS family permease